MINKLHSTESKQKALQTRLDSKAIEHADLTTSANAYLKRVTDRYKALFLKILRGSYVSPMKKIQAKCLDCCNFQTEEITNCNISTCALWSVRPYQNLLPAGIGKSSLQMDCRLNALTIDEIKH